MINSIIPLIDTIYESDFDCYIDCIDQDLKISHYKLTDFKLHFFNVTSIDIYYEADDKSIEYYTPCANIINTIIKYLQHNSWEYNTNTNKFMLADKFQFSKKHIAIT